MADMYYRQAGKLFYWKSELGSITGRNGDYFSSPPRLDRLWGPLSLLSSGYWGSFPGGEAVGT
jgi:hypothetical protein